MGTFCFLFINGIFVFFAVNLLSCGPQPTARDRVNAQYDADQKAKESDLAPAEGTYKGTMLLAESHQKFDFRLEVRRIVHNERAPQSQNPSETVQIPKLSGSLSFPALDRLSIVDYANFQALLNPLGGFSRVMFDYGDYNPNTKILVLPYAVPGYSSGNFGELTGNLNTSHFTGKWFAKPFGDVGTFDATLTSLDPQEGQ